MGPNKTNAGSLNDILSGFKQSLVTVTLVNFVFKSNPKKIAEPATYMDFVIYSKVYDLQELIAQGFTFSNIDMTIHRFEVISVYKSCL